MAEGIPEPPTLELPPPPPPSPPSSSSNSEVQTNQDFSSAARQFTEFLNKNFAVYATIVASVAGAITGGIEGYQHGKQSSISALQQTSINENLNRIPKAEAVWYVGSSSLREAAKKAGRRGTIYGATIASLTYGELWFSKNLPPFIPTYLAAIPASVLSGSILGLGTRGLPGMASGGMAGPLILGLPYALFIASFRYFNPLILQEALKLTPPPSPPTSSSSSSFGPTPPVTKS